ncbi:MAG: phosphatase PAP2 family protein [Spirochaetales bacterium]|nr:phosphatase PAP2 family protein [Spirochaetales bacterium]
MQEQILLFFQNIASNTLDVLFVVITFFGEQEVFIAVIGFVFWNISRKKGITLGIVLLFSASINEGLKLIFRAPRPFQVLDEITGKRLSTAEGYAFPSGHTQSASTFYISLAYIIRKKWYTLAAIFLSLLVGISRVYLGVHWPIDTAVGFVLGIFIAALLYPVILKWVSDDRILKFLTIGFGLFTLTASITLALLETFSVIPAEVYTNMMKSSALFSGLLLASFLSETHIKFGNDGSITIKVVRYLIGLATSFMILSVSKLVLPDIAAIAFCRYFLTAFWAFALFPFIGIRTGLFQRSDS